MSEEKAESETYSEDFAVQFVGGRGFAAKILWDDLPQKTEPLSPENLLVLAVGPLTGYPLPNSGKLVVAAKSPLTGGYGDGNLGTWAAVHMRKAGFDALVVEGKAKQPTVLRIKDEAVEFLEAQDLWGLSSFEAEAHLRRTYGRAAGIVSIGQGGENLVHFACVVSQEGRAGGRPGMGAVMGSKNLKAVLVDGTKKLSAANLTALREQGLAGYREILAKPAYKFWKRQGTLSTTEWANENNALPTDNYREATFANAESIGGFAAEAIKIGNRGCPNCNMTCGNVVRDAENRESELDYENVAMLGGNIGLGDMAKVSVLNRLADELGLDSISLGNAIGFVMEASERGLVSEKFGWGDYEAAKKLCFDIAFRRGLGNVLAEGVRVAAEKLGDDAPRWAMHVKGLEISAYNCHAAPAMALAYATSPIGAHHKDAWVIGWETVHDRFGYGEEKASHVVETQNNRGVFELLGVCRFPYVNLGFDRAWYPKYMTLATGQIWTWEKLVESSERVFNLMRCFWIREHEGPWSSSMDAPPDRWFNEPLKEGTLVGSRLDREKYAELLQSYYRKRGWDSNGVPTETKLRQLKLPEISLQVAGPN